MLPDDCTSPLHPAAARGLALFNAGEYFEAHEALEEAWRAEPGPIRGLYQAILQVAVTYYHIQNGNHTGALKVAMRCQPKLAAWPDTCRGIDIAGLRRDFASVFQTLSQLGPENIQSFDQTLFRKIND